MYHFLSLFNFYTSKLPGTYPWGYRTGTTIIQYNHIQHLPSEHLTVKAGGRLADFYRTISVPNAYYRKLLVHYTWRKQRFAQYHHPNFSTHLALCTSLHCLLFFFSTAVINESNCFRELLITTFHALLYVTLPIFFPDWLITTLSANTYSLIWSITPINHVLSTSLRNIKLGRRHEIYLKNILQHDQLFMFHK